MSKSRAFQFKYINATNDWSNIMQLQQCDTCEYMCAYETTNNHIHGFVRFTNPITSGTLHKLLNKYLNSDVEVDREKNNDQYYKSQLQIYTNHIEYGKPAKKNIKNAHLIKQIENQEKILEKQEKILEKQEKQIETLGNENTKIVSMFNEFVESFGEEKMKQLMEICMTVAKNNPTTIINNVNNGTINNNRFNLNMFLNEHCKDAMDIYDFINGIDINLEDVLLFKRMSHTEAVTRIFDKAYKEVEVNKRPIHCTDLKRETFYVRNDKQWINDETKKLTEKAMDILSNRSFKNLHKWKSANPDYIVDEDLKTEYSKIMRNLLGAVTDREVEENHKTFVHAIAKTIYIDKPAALTLMRNNL